MTGTALVPTRVANPYLEEFLEHVFYGPFVGSHQEWQYKFLEDHPSNLERRGLSRYDLVKKFSWAIPTDEALRVIKTISHERPILEMGAGRGYWASLLRMMGAEIIAYDAMPWGGNPYTDEGEAWTMVLPGEPDVLSNFKSTSNALMLCWPPYNESMASNALDNFSGDTLIYIGEDSGGCCGDTLFWNKLGEDNGVWFDDDDDDEKQAHEEALALIEASPWSEELIIDIPQWPYIHDFLTIYRR